VDKYILDYCDNQGRCHTRYVDSLEMSFEFMRIEISRLQSAGGGGVSISRWNTRFGRETMLIGWSLRGGAGYGWGDMWPKYEVWQKVAVGVAKSNSSDK
jgi:hypothetical protein